MFSYGKRKWGEGKCEKCYKTLFYIYKRSMRQCGKVLNKRGKKGKNVENMW